MCNQDGMTSTICEVKTASTAATTTCQSARFTLHEQNYRRPVDCPLNVRNSISYMHTYSMYERKEEENTHAEKMSQDKRKKWEKKWHQ